VIGVSMMHPQRLLLVRWVRFSRQLIEMSFSSVACCFFESDRLFAVEPGESISNRSSVTLGKFDEFTSIQLTKNQGFTPE